MKSISLRQWIYGAIALGVILAGVFLVPRAMEAPGRNLVQAAVSSLINNPNLFSSGERLDTIVQRSMDRAGGRISRDQLAPIVSEIVRAYRPDFPPDTVSLVTEFAVNLVLNQLPAFVSDDRVLTPLLTTMIPRAISNLSTARVPERYPDLTTRLFKETTWLWITVTAAVFGFAALAWATLKRVASPQEESARTRIVDFLVTWPGLFVSLGLLTYNLYPLLMNPKSRIALYESSSAFTATLFICGLFLLLALVVYVCLALMITLLPYWFDRVSILAVWRRIFVPPVVNFAGEMLHQARIDAILKRIIKLLFDQFAAGTSR